MKNALRLRQFFFSHFFHQNSIQYTFYGPIWCLYAPRMSNIPWDILLTRYYSEFDLWCPQISSPLCSNPTNSFGKVSTLTSLIYPVIKVFADFDIQWLQMNFGLYQNQQGKSTLNTSVLKYPCFTSCDIIANKWLAEFDCYWPQMTFDPTKQDSVLSLT